MKRYLTPDEVGLMIGVSPKTLANWRCGGFGPAWIHAGKMVRYSEFDFIGLVTPSLFSAFAAKKVGII